MGFSLDQRGPDFLYYMHKSLWLVFRFGLVWICRMSYPASLSDYVGETTVYNHFYTRNLL
jgi:hypothetical protein